MMITVSIVNILHFSQFLFIVPR